MSPFLVGEVILKTPKPCISMVCGCVAGCGPNRATSTECHVLPLDSGVWYIAKCYGFVMEMITNDSMVVLHLSS